MPAERTEPQFEPGDRVFSHYVRDRSRGISGWGTIALISHTVRGATHGVTGGPLPDSTWYWVDTDEGGRELLDDAHGDWDMARIIPPSTAKVCGYGGDPRGQA